MKFSGTIIGTEHAGKVIESDYEYLRMPKSKEPIIFPLVSDVPRPTFDDDIITYRHRSLYATNDEGATKFDYWVDITTPCKDELNFVFTELFTSYRNKSE